MASETGTQADKPRLLIPITILFAVRYVVRTGLLDRLREVCDPVLALSWDDDRLASDLRRSGATVIRLPDPQIGSGTRALLTGLGVHFTRRLASPSTAIDRARRHVDRQAADRARRWAAWHRDRVLSHRPGDEDRLLAALVSSLGHDTNIDAYDRLLAEHRIAAVFSVTPFAAQEQVLLLASERRNLPRCTSILSFDNVTTRPPLPVAFDRYLVWNRYNRSEILRSYRGARPEHVRIVGPAQFDFYRHPDFQVDRSTWRSAVGLGDGPAVLFGAGAPEVAPQETQYVEHLCRAIDDASLPDDLRVVVRRHPVDASGRWDRFAHHPAVVFDEPGRLGRSAHRPGQVDLDRDAIVGLCGALAHTEVHVSTSSTMTLDGAFYDRPQIGPAYDVEPGHRYRRLARDLYRREHFGPLITSGGLQLAHTPDQLITLVRAGLERPAEHAEGRRRMLEDLCTYVDGRCTDRVADEVIDFLSST